MSSSSSLDVAQIDCLINQSLEQYFTGKEYDVSQSLGWSQEAADLVLDKINTQGANLTGLHKYKYIVNCSIMKNGTGLQTSSACLWSSTTDVATFVKFEQRDIACTVHLYAIAYD